jgi:uncharacterized protein YbaP (TraB family)
MKKLVLLMLFVAVTVLSISCSDMDELTAGTIQRIWDENDPRINGAIHRVEYGENVAYIFGTAHVSRNGWFPLADVVENTLRQSDILLVEVEEIVMGEYRMRQAAARMSHLPDNLTWSEFLPEVVYEHLVETISTWGILYENVNTMNPMFLIEGLDSGLMLEMSDANSGFEDAVDAYIVNLAKEMNIPVFGLENIEQPLNIAFDPPVDVLHARIMGFVSREEHKRIIQEGAYTFLDELLNLYENNEFELIPHHQASDIGTNNECLYAIYFMEYAATFRSTHFAYEIVRLLREAEEPTTFFVAVGLAHVIMSGAGEGFTDIIQQLELAGFNVIP